MAKNHKAVGKTVRITGATTGINAGSLYRRASAYTGAGNLHGQRYWIGVVLNDIQGTTQALTTLDGRPILIGDGVAAESQYGDGKGDMMIEEVHTFRLPASGTVVNDGAPVYASFTSNVASGVTPNSGYALSGALVGFAFGDSYDDTTAPFAGMRVVDVKLLGLPLHGLDKVGPAAAS